MPEYTLSIFVEGQDHGATSILARVNGGIGTLGVTMGTLVAHGIEAAGRALLDFGKAGLSVATEYQASLNMFQAVSGATETQLQQVGDLAKQLGADMSLPATSAGQAAQAMTELAKAGLSVNDAMTAAKGTLQLAAAGAVSEAQAAEIAANALNSFGLSGDKAAMIADLFAAAANKSSLEVTDVADGFKMASAVFSAFQGPVVGSEKALKDLTTAMALLGNVGIKGSDAGTSLKQMLLQLTGPSGVAKDEMKALMFAAQGASGGMEQLTKIIGGKAKDRSEGLKALAAANPALADMGDIAFDAAGKMRPLQDIIRLTTLATKDMTDEQRDQALTSIFGADATRAVIGLMRAGPDAFASMETAISEQGAAADLAGARMKGLGGAWEGFKSTLETTQLASMEGLLGPLEGLVRSFAGALSGATPGIVAFVQTSIVPAVAGFAQLLDQFAQAPDKMAFLTGLFVSAKDAVIGWALGMRDQAVTAIQDWAAGLVSGAQSALPGWIEALTGWAVAAGAWAIDAIPGLLINLLELRNQAVAWVLGQVPGWIEAVRPWSIAFLQWVVDAIPGLLTEFGRLTGNLLDAIGRALPGIVESLARWGAELVDWVIDAAPGLLRNILILGTALFHWIGDRIPGIAEQLGKWALAFVDWVGTTAPKLIIALGGLFGQFLTWIADGAPGLSAQLDTWTDTFVTWATEKLGPALVAALANIGTEVWGKLTELWTGAWAPGTRGAQILQGLGLADGTGSQSGGSFASGVTNFSGGLARVHAGELLVNMPRGTDVIPAGATSGFGGGGGGGGGAFTWTGDLIVQGATDQRETARQVREELIKIGKRNQSLPGGVLGGY